MRDVARTAGVSLTTVSRVVNGDPTVQAPYVDRVNKAVARLSFSRNTLARDLRTGGRTATIGLVIEDFANPFYALIAREIEQTARSHDTLLIVGSSEEDPDRERELTRDLRQRRVDGLVIVPADRHGAKHGDAYDQTIPTVFIDRKPAGVSADCVLIDNYGGAKACGEYLLSRGHRRVAVLGYDRDLYTIRERLAGLRAAAADAGATLDESWWRFGLLTSEQAAAATATLLREAEGPTAFFCTNNRMTLGAVQELWRRRRRLDIVGFDDIEIAELFPVPVALVAYDTGLIGRRAAELLFRRIGGHRGHPQEVVVPTRLVIRGGPAPE